MLYYIHQMKEAHTMFYTNIEEFIEPMPTNEWFDLMTDCYADEMAKHFLSAQAIEEGI